MKNASAKNLNKILLTSLFVLFSASSFAKPTASATLKWVAVIEDPRCLSNDVSNKGGVTENCTNSVSLTKINNNLLQANNEKDKILSFDI